MLRTIRRKLVLGRAAIPRATASTSAARAAEVASAIEEEPYGQAYGAGPSRLPYQRPNPPLVPTRAEAGIACSDRDRENPPTPRSRRNGARAIRHTLSRIQTTGHYANPQAFSHHLAKYDLPLVTEMSRLELHAAVHHLARLGRSTLALSIITQVIDASASSRPTVRRVFSQKTLDALLSAESERLESVRTVGASRVTAIKLNVVADFLRALQSIRHHRPAQLYTLLVQMSIHQHRPDKAAEIFVGLVEEWVTEGRVAEGADAEGFYEGGGPPRQLRESIAKKHKSWWTGVRTWTLPGEVLSPHDRLDLWHPTKLSLGGKFKNFLYPLATSPPSLVPPPSARLLNPILASLRLDPKIAAPADFEASMRACAILANTVLSRTLPLSSLAPLLRALEATPSHPPVYPANLDPIPTTDAWAYEAFTQVHLALQSFFFSPPISAASFALARANETILSGSPPTTHADKYRLQPLAFGDTVILLKYALEKMRSTQVLEKLVRYVKRSFNFGWTKPAMWNALLGGATLLGDRPLARAADEALFGQTTLARLAPATSEPGADGGAGAIPRRIPLKLRESALSPLLVVDPSVAVQADEESLVALIHNLGKTDQIPRLTRLVYELIPFLDSRLRDEFPEIPAEETPNSGRVSPNHLTPQLYSALISSLARAGKTGLAQRVYNLALDAEKSWKADHLARHPSSSPSDIPSSLRLPISLFTAMLKIYAKEVRVHRSQPRQRYPVGWIVPKAAAGQSAYAAAGIMARQVYLQAAARFPSRKHTIRPTTPYLIPSDIDPSDDTPPPMPYYGPDAVFFDMAFRALAPHLGLTRTSSGKPSQLLGKIIEDMRTYNVPIPPRVLERYEAAEGEVMPRLTPREYKVHADIGGRKAREERAERLRGLAEALVRADEEGLWRDQVIKEEEGGGEGRVEGEVLEMGLLEARG